MRVTGGEPFRFEPTVFSAMRRYRFMVLAVALMIAAAAGGYALMQTEVYRAGATVTVPQSSLSQGQASDQYLDSQVLLLQSPQVADRAVRIANGALGSNVLTERDFSGQSKSVKITPPEGATPGSYGSNIVTVSFTWPGATVAQVGANALLQAFDDVRSETITAQGQATVAGIEKAIHDARTWTGAAGAPSETATISTARPN
jgi:capsular polysaccharide biosynthesis protein